MDVLVFGAGSLGSLIGGLLARSHRVTLVGRDPHVHTVRESGLRVTGEFDLTVSPAATTGLSDAPAAADFPGVPAATDLPDGGGEDGTGGFDCTVVTVKAFDTADTARALALADTGLGTVVSLQNGMGNEEVLADALGSPVLAGTCTYGARLVEPGVVECTGVGGIAVGSRRGGPSEAAGPVAAAFREGGIDATAAADMPRRLWEKLAVNAGINAATALARLPNGALVDGPAGGTAREAARETARVARAADVDLDEEDAAARLDTVAEATAPNVSSMRADVESESRTEVDAINGYVTERASGSDVHVPINRTLAALVRAWERERGLR